MIVVSNASPLIGLAGIGQLELLPQLYTQIHIPLAVWTEIVIDGAGRPGAIELAQANWISQHEVTNRTLVQALNYEVDQGEAEAIALALQLSADLTLLDERLGRAQAQRLGVRCAGVLGILRVAHQRHLLTTIKPHLDALRYQVNFRISEALYRQILADCGELG